MARLTRSRKRTLEKLSEVKKKYDTTSMSKLAAEYGVCINWLKDILSQNGVKLRVPGTRPPYARKITDDQAEEAISLMDDGYCSQDVIDMLGLNIDKSLLARMALRKGVVPRTVKIRGGRLYAKRGVGSTLYHRVVKLHDKNGLSKEEIAEQLEMTELLVSDYLAFHEAYGD